MDRGKQVRHSLQGVMRSDGMYALAIVVDHNRDPVQPGAGSCIFIHPWVTPGMPSPGCTVLARAPVERLVRWLDPAAHPLLVQLPRAALRALAETWDLPVGGARSFATPRVPTSYSSASCLTTQPCHPNPAIPDPALPRACSDCHVTSSSL
jgi:hypothetical protein